jgi:hypothetical protein
MLSISSRPTPRFLTVTSIITVVVLTLLFVWSPFKHGTLPSVDIVSPDATARRAEVVRRKCVADGDAYEREYGWVAYTSA